jgi:hypothetical protein
MSSPELLDEICRWLRFACEDLEAAEALLGEADFIPRHACWLAQQAAEKALKAALASQQVNFPFRHDLDALRNLLPEGWYVKTQRQRSPLCVNASGGKPTPGTVRSNPAKKGHPGSLHA